MLHAEILSNIALREGKDAAVDCVVIDEFHYYADRERGVAWQIPLLVLERAQFLLMSATLGPTETFEKSLTKLTRRTTVTVRSGDRPVPLAFEYRETPAAGDDPGVSSRRAGRPSTSSTSRSAARPRPRRT